MREKEWRRTASIVVIIGLPWLLTLKEVKKEGGCSSLPLLSNSPPLATSFKEYVEAGILQASLGFDPGTVPAFIQEGPERPCLTRIRNASILILGDSIARNMILDGCSAAGGQLESWLPPDIPLIHSRELGCILPRDVVIGFLFIFGSAPKGPYHLGYANSNLDERVDTVLRVPFALDFFARRFGAPGFIVVKTDLWDLQGVNAQSLGPSWDRGDFSSKAAMFAMFIANARSIFRDLHTRLPNAYLAVQTSSDIRWSLDLFHEYENAMRYLSRTSTEIDITVYDFQQLLVDLPLDEVLRDGHHPNQLYSSALFNITFRSMQNWANCTFL